MIGQSMASGSGAWPNRPGRLTSLLDGMERVGSWLSLILLMPVLVAMLALLMLHQRYVRGRTWNSILGLRPDA
jgi:predicted lysophospholipase L1 biosynthesis ABC-type transport system permease subunit